MNTLVVLVGTGIGILLALLIFRATIGDFRLLLTYLYDDAVVFRSGNGDILFWQSEFVQELENPEEILSVHRIQADEIGFRLPANPSDTYQVVALGDSYTEGANVPTPWTDIFARDSGLSTRNLGFRGYGITHYRWTWEQYGIQENPDVLIIGFFGGNDIFTAGLDNEPPFEIPRNVRLNETEPFIVTNYADEGEDLRLYPKYLDNGTPIAYLLNYVHWMNIEEEQLTGSVNYQVISDNLQQIQETASDDTCLVFAYFPSKPEVYFPYMQPIDYPDLLIRLHTPLLNSDGTLHLVEDFNIDLERTLRWRTNTGDIMTELASSLGYETINLLEVFEERASEGELLYYTYDTHWNQAGQNLAGATIADFVDEQCNV
ncbi:MAG: SGNH/GDSL hydrolase family protein [Chloroflexota bacterium]